jgi:hypothetical protein
VSAEAEEALIVAGREAISRTFREEGICEDLWGHAMHTTVIGPLEWRRRCGLRETQILLLVSVSER